MKLPVTREAAEQERRERYQALLDELRARSTALGISLPRELRSVSVEVVAEWFFQAGFWEGAGYALEVLREQRGGRR